MWILCGTSGHALTQRMQCTNHTEKVFLQPASQKILTRSLHLSRRFKLPFQKELSSFGIASKGRRAGLLLDLLNRDSYSSGFHGEDEAGAGSEGEGEGSTLTGQGLA